MRKPLLVMLVGLVCLPLGMVVFVGCAQASKTEKPVAKLPSQGVTTQIDFTGTVLEIGFPTRREKVIPVGVDPNWIFRVRVSEVAKDDHQIRNGQEVCFLIHSPVKLLVEDRDKAIGKTYQFRLTRRCNKKGEIRYQLLDRIYPALESK